MQRPASGLLLVHRGMELDGGGVGLVPFPGHSSDRWGLIIIAIEAYHLSIYLSVSIYLYISTMDISWAWSLGSPLHRHCVHGQVHKIDLQTHHWAAAATANPFHYIAYTEPHSDTGEGL